METILKHSLFYLSLICVLSSCNQPIANSLLVDQKDNCAADSFSSCTDSSSNNGSSILDIQPDSTSISVNMEQSDRVEITGSCKDLDRKNNRILVEVFAGEDEATDPYISNVTSNNCLTTTSPTQSGLTSASGRCFWVTKGAGLIEDAGQPSEKSFPQCYNGQFGFSVRLGQVLLNPVMGQPNLKYLVRVKLRTQDGTVSDSTFGRVVIDRNLSTPVITEASNDAATHKCVIKSAPARFNFGILYKLVRTYTDILLTSAGSTNLYPGITMTTSTVTPGSSVFEWSDNGLADGVIYNYTLTSTENNFLTYVPSAPTASSAVVTCETPRPAIQLSAAVANTCYFSALNFNGSPSVVYDWAYSTTSTWIGASANVNSGYTPASGADCVSGSGVCTQPGLVAGTTYYFAARTKRGAEVGKWSETVACKP